MQNTMSNGKEFYIEDVLTIFWDGFLVSHPEGKYKSNFATLANALDFMVGESLYTHAYGRACHECSPYVQEWYPELSQYKIREWDYENAESPNYVLRQIEIVRAKIGTHLTLWQIPQDDHEIKDPVQELADMGFADEIMEINLSDSEGDILPYGDLPSDIN